jgi:hypothetical protein
MMQRQPIEALMTRITKNKLDRDEGLKKVKNLFADDNEVLATKTKLTLTDPLLLTRIKTPVRARTCGHFQVYFQIWQLRFSFPNLWTDSN